MPTSPAKASASRSLPDRRFGDGCSALGAVQLLDIGTPVTNLGAMTCPLARQFARWVREAVQPAAQAVARQPVRQDRDASAPMPAGRSTASRAPGSASMACANAVDISAFVLADGRRITVLDGWNGERRGRPPLPARRPRRGCRRFSIGLGPDSDAFHRDHLHFDMGRGPYCR